MINIGVTSEESKRRSSPGERDSAQIKRATLRRWIAGVALFAIAITIGVAVVASDRVSTPRPQSADDRAMEEWVIAEFDAGEGDVAFLLGNTLSLRIDPKPSDGDGPTSNDDNEASDAQTAATGDTGSDGGIFAASAPGAVGGAGSARAGSTSTPDIVLATLSDGMTFVTATADNETGDADASDGQVMIVARADSDVGGGITPHVGSPADRSVPSGSPQHLSPGAPSERAVESPDAGQPLASGPPATSPIDNPPVSPLGLPDPPDEVGTPPAPLSAPVSTPVAAADGPRGHEAGPGTTPNTDEANLHPLSRRDRDADPSGPLIDPGAVGALDPPSAPASDADAPGLSDHAPQADPGAIPETLRQQVEALAGDPVGDGDGGEFLVAKFEDVGGDTTDAAQIDDVPEPSPLLLIALGLVGLGALGRRRNTTR